MTPLDERGRLLAALLTERFEFLGFLGKGGFASVYKVRSRTLQRFEALKVLHERNSDEDAVGFAKRFQQEARVAASLEHPNIVKIFEFGEVGGNFWYSMQLIDGPTISRELRIRQRLDEEKAVRISVPLLDALEYSHARGVVHRDVKPDNIILDEWDRPYLMDFGIAKLDDNVVMTEAGRTLGSPAYLSPEQARGLKLDGRTDIYSFGVTLYQMLTGAVPFQSADRMATVTRRLTEDPEPLSKTRPGTHPELERIVLRALARDVANRYAHAREMRNDLQALLVEMSPTTASRVAGVPHSSTPPHVDVQHVPGAWGLQSSSQSQSDAIPTAIAPAFPGGFPHGASTSSEAPLAMRGVKSGRLWRRAWLGGAAVGVLLSTVLFVFARSASRRAVDGKAPAPASAGPHVPVPTSPAASPVEPTAAAPAPTPQAAIPSDAPRAEASVPRAPARTERRERSEGRAEPAPAAPRTARRAKYPPDIAEQPEVTLSPEVLAACSGRSVGVSVLVGEDGTLKSSKVISTVSPLCDETALGSLKRYRFTPALDEEGKPIEARFSFAVQF